MSVQTLLDVNTQDGHYDFPALTVTEPTVVVLEVDGYFYSVDGDLSLVVTFEASTHPNFGSVAAPQVYHDVEGGQQSTLVFRREGMLLTTLLPGVSYSVRTAGHDGTDTDVSVRVGGLP